MDYPKARPEIVQEDLIKCIYKIKAAWIMPDDTPKPPDFTEPLAL